MLYQILTIVNIMGSLTTIVALVRVLKNYFAGPRMAFYIMLTIVSMTLIIFGQFYSLTYPEKYGRSVFKIPVMFWWCKTLYFSWAIRFSLVKK